MASNRDKEAHRRARKARKRAERRLPEDKRPKRVVKCRHTTFSSRKDALFYSMKKYGRMRVPAKCPKCGKYIID